MAYLRLGEIHLRRGRHRVAIPAFQRLIEILREGVGTAGATALKLGVAYALAGRAGDGLALLAQAEGHVAGRFVGGWTARWLAELSEGYLLVGRAERAREVADRALALARDGEERGHHAWILRLLGEVDAHSERPDPHEAEGHFLGALRLAEGLGMRPLQAHCHLGLGKLYRRTGPLDEARAELATAVAMLREMGMAHWLSEAERSWRGRRGSRPAGTLTRPLSGHRPAPDGRPRERMTRRPDVPLWVADGQHGRDAERAAPSARLSSPARYRRVRPSRNGALAWYRS
jgi:tetratricopeptide (TPR) repeat protein